MGFINPALYNLGISSGVESLLKANRTHHGSFEQYDESSQRQT